MCDLKLLIVEDNDQDLNTCRDYVNDFKRKNLCNIELIVCKTIEEAFQKLDMTFDGAIIDIKLDTQGTGDEGNIVLNKIREAHLRIPVAVFTATPGSVEEVPGYIGIFKKGSHGPQYKDLLLQFLDIYNTGLTRIMGGRGKIEDFLGRVFNENLMPEQYRKKWIEYGRKDTSRTERALLRYALNHLFQLLDEDDDKYFPEEFYLTSPLNPGIKTGNIAIDKERQLKFVVLNPACDLVIRGDGKMKTDKILIVEIDTQEVVFTKYSSTKDQENLLKNNLTTYYHWLPKTDFFDGGFVNFRKLFSLEIDEFNAKFGKPIVQISSPFVKDIVSRFSVYYARQGQPEIENDA
jgi:hypothetical protein